LAFKVKVDPDLGCFIPVFGMRGNRERAKFGYFLKIPCQESYEIRALHETFSFIVIGMLIFENNQILLLRSYEPYTQNRGMGLVFLLFVNLIIGN